MNHEDRFKFWKKNGRLPISSPLRRQLPARQQTSTARSPCRAGADPQLYVADGLSFARHATGVLKKLARVFEHDDALRVLIAETALIRDREQLLADALVIIRTKLSGSELRRLFASATKLIQVIIVGKAITTLELLLASHSTTLRFAKISGLAIAFLSAIRRIVRASPALTDLNPTRVL
jgi:hypothetical protein